MDVKQAVQTAKKHVAEIFADEAIANVGLEEVEFDELNGVWAITRGWKGSGRRPPSCSGAPRIDGVSGSHSGACPA